MFVRLQLIEFKPRTMEEVTVLRGDDGLLLEQRQIAPFSERTVGLIPYRPTRRTLYVVRTRHKPRLFLGEDVHGRRQPLALVRGYDLDVVGQEPAVLDDELSPACLLLARLGVDHQHVPVSVFYWVAMFVPFMFRIKTELFVLAIRLLRRRPHPEVALQSSNVERLLLEAEGFGDVVVEHLDLVRLNRGVALGNSLRGVDRHVLNLVLAGDLKQAGDTVFRPVLE